MKENANLRCPNCKSVLMQFTDIKDIFKCPMEDIVWKLSDKDNGKFLEMLHAPGSYKGVMISRLQA